MSKQTYMKKHRTIEMKRGEDGVYRMVSEEHNLGYGSDSRLRIESIRGGLVDLVS